MHANHPREAPPCNHLGALQDSPASLSNALLQGLLVMVLEHADGSSGAAQRADGSWMYYQGLGTGAVLEAKCDYRLQECDLALQLLHQLNAGGRGAGCGRPAMHCRCSCG